MRSDRGMSPEVRRDWRADVRSIRERVMRIRIEALEIGRMDLVEQATATLSEIEDLWRRSLVI